MRAQRPGDSSGSSPARPGPPGIWTSPRQSAQSTGEQSSPLWPTGLRSGTIGSPSGLPQSPPQGPAGHLPGDAPPSPGLPNPSASKRPPGRNGTADLATPLERLHQGPDH
ncbi:hypothetical protein ILUMI_07838 [Ignelater luminosus]|uniref:Uncharacterized protein n=1 Tax=Ignelater luminosus TaxID=2038154 RepID=A0A8K0GFY6_IGNLU|nr:hypothetical protein ILUMI_07838 [Ignelater luminosus]